DVVDRRLAPRHETVLVEFPLLVAEAAEPAAARVVPFVDEAHGDAVVVKGPDLFDQAILELRRPLAAQELDDLGAPRDELAAIAPPAVRRIRARDARGIARVPGVLGHARLARGGVGIERRQRRPRLGLLHCVRLPASGRALERTARGTPAYAPF